MVNAGKGTRQCKLPTSEVHLQKSGHAGHRCQSLMHDLGRNGGKEADTVEVVVVVLTTTVVVRGV